MKGRLIPPGFIVAILLVGAAQLGGQPPIAPVVTSAVADLGADPETLSLIGANFGSNPQVFIGNDMGTLDELTIDLMTLTDTLIEAELGPIEPGTYLLVVSTGPSQIQMAAMDLTIGVVGPEGPEGPEGPPGAPNPNILTEAFNTAIGVNALINNSGSFNTASGYKALRDNTTGNQNTAIGGQALISNTTGGNNTASGVNALGSNTTGSSNTAGGHGALGSNTTGSTNTARGQCAQQEHHWH